MLHDVRDGVTVDEYLRDTVRDVREELRDGRDLLAATFRSTWSGCGGAVAGKEACTHLQARADHNEQIYFLAVRKQAAVKGIVEGLSEERNVWFENRLVLPRIDIVLFFILLVVISAVTAIAARAGRSAICEFALLAGRRPITWRVDSCNSCANRT